jgi:hypothetical protein
MSEPPSIIRHDSEHSVTVTEGSLVATSKPSDPAGPVVRQNLAGEQATDAPEQEAAADLPPPITAAAEPEAVIFQRRQDVPAEEVFQAPEPQVLAAQEPVIEPEPQAPQSEPQAPVLEQQAPVAEPQAPVFERRHELPEAVPHELPPDQRPAAAEPPAPVFERSVQDAQVSVALPAALDAAQQDGESAVDRFLRERRLATQAQQGDEPEQGPILERSMQDRFVALPSDSAGSASADAPVFERAIADRSVTVAIPPAVAAAEQAIVQAPREGSSRPVAAAPALEPVPWAQAQQIIAETAQDVQARVEQAIGAADGQWAEMDFPARVVKLKMENEKVRVKLDELEQMAEQQAQQMADQRAR